MGKFDLEGRLIGFSVLIIEIANELPNSKGINNYSIINKSKIVNRCSIFDIQKSKYEKA